MIPFSPSSSISFLFFFFFLFSLSVFSVSSSHTDAQQLISLKSSLPNPNLLQNWLSNGDPCSFSGVSCKETRVSAIDLSFVSLSSNFSHVFPLLAALDHLESLSLKSTNLTGSISLPAGFKCSPLLSSLDLSLNGLFGSVSDASYLGFCSNIKSLNLSFNAFDFPPKDSAAGLKLDLQVLDLSSNRIVGSKLVPWVLSAGCSNLQFLALNGNKISGEINLSSCNKLQHMDISGNNFSAGIPSLGDCSVLEYLDISGNKFTGDVGNTLSSCLQLRFLNLSSNQFQGSIPSFSSPNLWFISLANNDFQGEIPVSIADSCSSLVHLDLSENGLIGGIPSGLGSCSLLESLDISKNNLSGELPIDVFAKMSSLKRLSMSDNKFFGVLSDSLSQLTTLNSLDLSSNNFSGSIPVGLCKDPKNSLKELFLQNNWLTGRIPASISNCSQLVSLDLSFNFLSGTIPSSLGSLSKLKNLIMWLNQLEGEIPSDFKNFQGLENLILDFNELTGTIPSGLSNCTNLNWISLSNNRLSGEIPRWIGQLPSLAILKLSNNSFHGRIPRELGDCRSLIWLDLNTNMLNGTIPPELFLQSGNIAVNFITGKSYAYIKNDGSKQCHGAGNLVEFAGIRQEQVNRISSKSPCNFTRVYKGMTQPTFNHNGSMIFLDLSHNMLSGSIPKEIGSTKYLYILDLGHNRVSGGIPQELGDLTKLNILDLSSNELEGSIPLSLTGLSSLMEIDLSNNHLNGSIPESAQFETFPASGFANNSGLCGYPLPQCRVDSAANANSQHQRSHRKQASLAGSVAMGLLFSLFCIFGLIIVVIEMKKRRKNKDAALDSYIDTHSQSGNTTTVNWKNTCVREALSINLATFEKPLRKLTFADLLDATNGFHDNTLIGSGGFGDVYKAQLKDGSIVAIKKLIHVSGQDSADFGDNNLVGWVKQHAKLDLTNVFDPELLKEDPNLKIELLEHLKVAVACLDDRSWRRPTMIQVMTMFKEIQAGSGMDSQSTIGSDNGGFSIDMVDMSLKEVPEGKY
ncbi:hypothetical protein SDJN03_11654, partial [Cucurbita argyrosperma subsp. sororia]